MHLSTRGLEFLALKICILCADGAHQGWRNRHLKKRCSRSSVLQRRWVILWTLRYWFWFLFKGDSFGPSCKFLSVFLVFDCWYVSLRGEHVRVRWRELQLMTARQDEPLVESDSVYPGILEAIRTGSMWATSLYFRSQVTNEFTQSSSIQAVKQWYTQ